MHKVRRAQILGIGVLTPALAGHLPAAARSADVSVASKVEGVTGISQEAAIQLLQDGLLTLAPAEKLKIAASHIRISSDAKKSPKKPSKARDVHQPLPGKKGIVIDNQPSVYISDCEPSRPAKRGQQR